jgi:predicted Zn finger-like uncharacterized protein
MSLITRCPHCASIFEVEPDELSIAQGWVRCGQCGKVFDGFVSVVSLSERRPLETPAPPMDATRIALEDLLLRKDTAASQAAPSVLTLNSSRLWRVSSCFLLVMGLCFQGIIHGRHEMAARMPHLEPVLAAVCAPLQCTIDPVRRLDGLVIDGSSFTPGDTEFVLNITLRNTQEVSLAMTSLELTLTDAQDRAIIRRVLKPSEMGAPSIMASGSVWNGAVSIEPLYATADIAGYRLVSFYP